MYTLNVCVCVCVCRTICLHHTSSPKTIRDLDPDQTTSIKWRHFTKLTNAFLVVSNQMKKNSNKPNWRSNRIVSPVGGNDKHGNRCVVSFLVAWYHHICKICPPQTGEGLNILPTGWISLHAWQRSKKTSTFDMVKIPGMRHCCELRRRWKTTNMLGLCRDNNQKPWRIHLSKTKGTKSESHYSCYILILIGLNISYLL